MNIMSTLKKFLTQSLLIYGLVGLALYGILHYLYEPITLGLSVENITILSIPTIFGMFLFQYFMGHSIFHRAFLGHGIVGLLWGLTFPILFHLSYTKPFYFYQFSNDFLFGILLFMGLTGLQYFCTLPQRFTRSIALCFAVFDWLLSLIPLGQIGYYLSFNHCITPATLMALYMTNAEEAFGFLKNTAGNTGLAGLIVGSFLLLGFFYFCNKKMPHLVNYGTTRPLRLGILGIALVAFLIYVPFRLFPNTCIVANWIEVSAYMKELQQYDTLHLDVKKSIQLDKTLTAAQKVPGTYILVIGESSSRDLMKVYNPAFPYDDTPWQEESSHDPNFIFFKHAYSSYVQTVPTLERALSERNQYDDQPFLQAANILDIAKKAGFHTSWFSNQGVYGEYDTAISLIAKTADTAKWAHETYMFSDKYDEALLPLLKEINPSKPNFIVIHIMGSHIYYNDRYPHTFSRWKKANSPYPDGIEAYANSQLYTDWLLQQIFAYAKENLNLQAMVYFSDHGEDLKTSHNPDIFNFSMTRIPFWVYISPAYQAAYPQTVTTLEARRKSYFTNDLLYDFLTGLLQAQNNRYDPSRDFSSPSYRFNQDNLTTMLGEHPLREDTE